MSRSEISQFRSVANTCQHQPWKSILDKVTAPPKGSRRPPEILQMPLSYLTAVSFCPWHCPTHSDLCRTLLCVSFSHVLFWSRPPRRSRSRCRDDIQLEAKWNYVAEITIKTFKMFLIAFIWGTDICFAWYKAFLICSSLFIVFVQWKYTRLDKILGSSVFSFGIPTSKFQQKKLNP